MKLKYPFYLHKKAQYESRFYKNDICKFKAIKQKIEFTPFLNVETGVHRLEEGVLPEVILQYLHDNFKNKKQKEIAYMILCAIYRTIDEPMCIASSEFFGNGYGRRDFTKAIEILLRTEIIDITRSHSRKLKIAGEYQYNIKTLLTIMKENKVFLQGIHGKRMKCKPTFDFDKPELITALNGLSLKFSLQHAVEYIQTLTVPEQFKHFATISMVPDGALRPSWTITDGVLYSCRPPVFTMKHELWQPNIVGGGERLYSIDFEACHPHMTSILLTGSPCALGVYERVAAHVPDQFNDKTRSEIKHICNKYLNGGRMKYATSETNARIKRAIMDSIGAGDIKFTEAEAVQRLISAITSEIIQRTTIAANERGIHSMFPIADGIYTTEQPGVIKEIMEVAAYTILGQPMAAKVKEIEILKPEDGLAKGLAT